jgi:mRNA interferase MazF
MACGDIYRVSLAVPPGDTQGREAMAVVVQDAAYGRGSPMILVAPVTEDPNAIGFPGTVALHPEHSALAPSSTAMVFQLRAIDRTRLLEKVGVVTEENLNEILGEVDRLTGRTPKPID